MYLEYLFEIIWKFNASIEPLEYDADVISNEREIMSFDLLHRNLSNLNIIGFL